MGVRVQQPSPMLWKPVTVASKPSGPKIILEDQLYVWLLQHDFMHEVVAVPLFVTLYSRPSATLLSLDRVLLDAPQMKENTVPFPIL